jgi:hypothetical protein
VIVQVAAGASDAGQLLVWEKRVLPDVAMLVMSSGANPVFLSVALAGAGLPMSDAMLMLAGVRLTTGTVPVPLSATLCGLPVALSVTLTVPVRVPEAVGLKATLIVQLAWSPSEAGQLLVWAKSPMVEMPVINNGAVPVLVTVTSRGVLVLLTGWFPKAIVVGLSETMGEVGAPVPLKATV